MSECEGIGYCTKCESIEYFFLSGSASKGSCEKCGCDREFKRGEVKVTYHQDADDDLCCEVVE